METQKIAKPSLLSQSGPFFLLAAYAVLIDKWVHFFWPMLMTAIIGYSATLIWKKRGFYFSLAALLPVTLYMLFRGPEPFWSSLIAACTGVSWILIFLGGQEADNFFEKKEKREKGLIGRCEALEEELRQALNSLSQENKKSIAEREDWNRVYTEAADGLSAVQRSLEASEKERDDLSEKCCAYQRKEVALQHALDDAQAQLIQLKNQEKPIILQEENCPEEQMQLSQMQGQHGLLREQFDEKSEVLNQTRKELFHMENAFLALQKAQDEKALTSSEENLGLMKDLKELEEQCTDLEAQVQNLQEIITSLSAPKKRVTRTRKLREDLPDLIQEKIDRVNSVEAS